ncbi:VOC family protein [Streptomyces abyssomicinicus]|uniref:VOC family protein n=1 Tax=Streptomyces abyssomicinicus TaxID=574929 RepID=UPI001250CF7A|nr:VOC family protein [Streptomyces abyssomicinicus]
MEAAHIRTARPSRDLDAAARFWIDGLGLSQLWRTTGDGSPGGNSLLMVGRPGASWHLELAHNALAPVEPRPTPEDLLVIYCAGPVPEALVARLEAHGGRRVTSHNPYWDRWGVTVEDPDGYRLVLSTRDWSNTLS